jgi:uncharacterized membrane protein
MAVYCPEVQLEYLATVHVQYQHQIDKMTLDQKSWRSQPKMSIRSMSFVVILLVTTGLAACEKNKVEQPQSRQVTYADDVEPIIQKHCTECHDAGKQGAVSSGLLTDSYESVMKGSRLGPVIHPGSAMASSLYILVSGKEDLTINMPHGKTPLSAEEIETIRVWIETGALEN